MTEPEINTLKPEKSDGHFVDSIFELIILNKVILLWF